MTLSDCWALVPEAARTCRATAGTFYLVASRESLNPAHSVSFFTRLGPRTRSNDARAEILRRLAVERENDPNHVTVVWHNCAVLV